MGKIYSLDDLRDISDEKLKAAYALNMCTVSVSQIIDYNDLYILEQEYDAILNNLNLEVIPKDETLLRTIMELLNTITFFRIQDIQKKRLEKEYQQRIKNAIWSAVPSPTMFVGIPANPVSVVLSLATQIGTSYMSYRREKNNALSNKEKEEINLQITAIEQLNALRRELFSTAWRLADKYDYPDCLRLTERQIKQYNEILMDPDEYRKYARLEAVQKNFFAYPPFWYYLAHTALYIATSTNDKQIQKTYLKNAATHFEEYNRINKFNIFREDQLTASANLEYIDLLLLEETPDKVKIGELIDQTVEKAGTSKDILQLCAVAYLRVGNQDAASVLFKFLVNEDYNTATNAKILSRLYVRKYLTTENSDCQAAISSEYEILKTRTEPLYLFPMPANLAVENQEITLEKRFIKTQINLLQKMYRNSLDAFAKQKTVDFNAVIPAPYCINNNRNQYYGHTAKSKELRMRDAYSAFNGVNASNYIVQLQNRGIRCGYVDVLNDTISGLEDLACFKRLNIHDELIDVIEKKLRNSKVGLVSAQEKLDRGDFTFKDYQNFVERYSFQYYTKDFFGRIKEEIMVIIENLTNTKDLDQWDLELIQFCDKHKLPAPETYIHTFKEKEQDDIALQGGSYFNYALVGESEFSSKHEATMQELMTNYLRDNLQKIIPGNSVKVSIFFKADEKFKEYWDIKRLIVSDNPVYLLRKKAIAIIKDNTGENNDLVLCVDGVRLVSKNKVYECINYDNITYNDSKSCLELGCIDAIVYTNKNIRIGMLKGIIEHLCEIASRNRNSV